MSLSVEPQETPRTRPARLRCAAVELVAQSASSGTARFDSELRHERDSFRRGPRLRQLLLAAAPTAVLSQARSASPLGRTLHLRRAVARGDVDDDFAARGFDNLGAWIMGRNMFAPSRGPWPDDSWKGWWGDNPPYHVPVFLITHHPRPPLTMQGGTTFHFVTDGIHAALERAREAARGKDVRLGGGAATIRQYLAAGLVDELHLAISPVLLGRGEHLLAGIDTVSLGYRCTEHASTRHATHVVLAK
jgi:dihydrofolate reductase